MMREKAFFRQVMSQFATGVTVVTTAGKKGLSGLTVNSFTSVSLDPPLILICVDLHSQTLPYLRANGSFVVNVLNSEQKEISRWFATPSVERSEFLCRVSHQVAMTGTPILDGVLAFIEARIVAEYPGGDHAIILGQVQTIGSGGKVQSFEADSIAHGILEKWSEREADNTHMPEQSTQAPLIYYRGQYRHLTHGTCE